MPESRATNSLSLFGFPDPRLRFNHKLITLFYALPLFSIQTFSSLSILSRSWCSTSRKTSARFQRLHAFLIRYDASGIYLAIWVSISHETRLSTSVLVLMPCFQPRGLNYAANFSFLPPQALPYLNFEVSYRYKFFFIRNIDEINFLF